jgi:hypothetical protein
MIVFFISMQNFIILLIFYIHFYHNDNLFPLITIERSDCIFNDQKNK